MSNGKLTFIFDGREALPVRAIPFVADLEKASPEWVAEYLAQGTEVPRGAIPLTAYQLIDDVPVAVIPRDWKRVVASLKGLVHTVREKRPNLEPADDHAGYAEYLEAIINKLPHSVFVWLDEFEATYQDHCERDYFGTDSLNLSPMEGQNFNTRKVVLHGFTRRVRESKSEAEQRDEVLGWHDCFMHASMWLNLASVKPDEGAMLLCRIDPHERNWQGDAPDPENIYVDDDQTSPDRYRVMKRAFEDVAETNPKPRTLLNWREVARRKGMRYHEWIDEYSPITADDLKVVGADSTASNQPASPDLAQANPLELNASVMVSNATTNNHTLGSTRAPEPDSCGPNKASQLQTVQDEQEQASICEAAARVATDSRAEILSHGVATKTGGGTHPVQRQTTGFLEMPRLSASEVSIAFVAGDSGGVMLEVAARKFTRRITLAELGLFDRRKGDMNMQGVLLLGLAQGQRIKTADQKMAKRIERLRKGLMSALGIKDNPIIYQDDLGYSPVFQLTDKRLAADQRSKREAERRTVSLDELQESGVELATCTDEDYPFENEGEMAGDAADEFLRAHG
jgi:hypothetical protein